MDPLSSSVQGKTCPFSRLDRGEKVENENPSQVVMDEGGNLGEAEILELFLLFTFAIYKWRGKEHENSGFASAQAHLG